jgi:hypothetical protein
MLHISWNTFSTSVVLIIFRLYLSVAPSKVQGYTGY